MQLQKFSQCHPLEGPIPPRMLIVEKLLGFLRREALNHLPSILRLTLYVKRCPCTARSIYPSGHIHLRPKFRQQSQIRSLSRRFRSGRPFTLSVVEVRPPPLPPPRFTPSAVVGLLPFTLVPSAQSTTIRFASELATTHMSANTLLV